MAKESTLTLTLKVDDQGTVVLDKFSKNIQKTSDDITKMSKAMQVVSVAAFINIAQQAMNAGTQIFNFARSVASAGNDIARMSRVFNMGTDDLQKWSYVTKMADVDIEGFGQGFKFLTRSIGEALQRTGDAAYAFRVLGINLKDSTGKTKDQQTVIMEVIGALEKYADGVNRDTLMLNIFGRSWMSFKPLVDQGTKTIEENRKEAERWNLILGKDTIRALSEAEDVYKKFSSTWQISKLEVWAPIVVIFSDILELILKIKGALDRPPSLDKFKAEIEELRGLLKQPGLMPFQKEMMEKRIASLEPFITEPSSWTKEWVEGWKPPKKPEAPGGDRGIWDLYGMTRAQYEFAKAQLEENAEWQTEWIKVLPDLPTMDTITKDLERWALEGEKIYEYGKATSETWRESEGYIPLDKLEAMNIELAKMAATASEWVSLGGFEMFGYEVMDAVPGKLKKIEEEYKKIDDVVVEFSSSLSSSWSNVVSGMIKGTETFASAAKKLFEGILEAFVSTISKMITQWLLFGSITGEKGVTSFFGKSSSGWGGLVGGVLSLFKLQEGGIVNRPTPAILGEAGPEAVIPLKEGRIPIEGGGKQNITIINISAMDTISIDDALRRNAFSILRIVNQDAKTAGSMRPLAR